MTWALQYRSVWHHCRCCRCLVLRLLARGLTNTDIAGRLYLSEGTVRNYVSAILSKLAVSDRTQAAVLALRYGLVKLSDL